MDRLKVEDPGPASLFLGCQHEQRTVKLKDGGEARAVICADAAGAGAASRRAPCRVPPPGSHASPSPRLQQQPSQRLGVRPLPIPPRPAAPHTLRPRAAQVHGVRLRLREVVGPLPGLRGRRGRRLPAGRSLRPECPVRPCQRGPRRCHRPHAAVRAAPAGARRRGQRERTVTRRRRRPSPLRVRRGRGRRPGPRLPRPTGRRARRRQDDAAAAGRRRARPRRAAGALRERRGVRHPDRAQGAAADRGGGGGCRRGAAGASGCGLRDERRAAGAVCAKRLFAQTWRQANWG